MPSDRRDLRSPNDINYQSQKSRPSTMSKFEIRCAHGITVVEHFVSPEHPMGAYRIIGKHHGEECETVVEVIPVARGQLDSRQKSENVILSAVNDVR